MFIVLLLALYIAASFGPPPGVKGLAWVGLFGAVLSVAWGYCIDRHRE